MGSMPLIHFCAGRYTKLATAFEFVAYGRTEGRKRCHLAEAFSLIRCRRDIREIFASHEITRDLLICRRVSILKYIFGNV